MQAANNSVIALLTIVGSSFGSGFMTSLVASRHDSTRRKREKLEEAWLALHDFGLLITTNTLHQSSWFEGRLTHDQLAKMLLKSAESMDRTAYQRLEMLVNIYLPSARGELARLDDCRAQLQAVVGACERLAKQGERVQSAQLDDLWTAHKAFERVEDELKERIAQAARAR